MPDPVPPSNGQTPRDEVLRELALFLRQRNKPESKPRFPFLDRPVVLALVGGVLVTFLSSLVQYHQQHSALQLQHRRSLLDQKFAQLRTLPALHQKHANVLNSLLVHILWRAEERAKPPDTQNPLDIEKWTKEINRLHDVYSQMEPIDGLLVQIETLFKSCGVRETAKKMRGRFTEFDALTQKTVRTLNAAGVVPETKIGEVRKAQQELVEALEQLEITLIQEIGLELSELSSS